MPLPTSKVNLLVVLLVLALGFICYGNTLHGPFLLDDGDNILLNGHIRIHNLAPTALVDAAFRSPMPTRPVANLSFALNYLLHGFWLPGYHLTNIFIHCLTGILLFFFIQGTFATPVLKPLLPPEKITLVAGAATLLWLLSPLNTQSVSYIVQRMNSLSAMFFLLSLVFYLKGRTAEADRPGYFAGCLLSGLLSLGAKEVAATLPPIIFLYEWFFFQDLDRGWLKKRLPWIIGAAFAILLIGWLYLGRDFSTLLSGYQGREFTLVQRLLTEPRVLCRYLLLIFVPYPGLLNLDYDYPLSTSLWHPPTTIIAMVALSGLFLAAIAAAPRHRFLSFAILWFFLNLLIESSVIPLEIIFDHRAYVPGMLIWPALLAMAWQLPERIRRLIPTGVIALLVLFATWTFQRNQVWADEVAINRDIVQKSPNKARAHTNLGLALAHSSPSQFEEGVSELKNAIVLDPNYTRAYLNLGAVYQESGRHAEAIANLKEAARLAPGAPVVYYPLSLAYCDNKQYPEAIAAARIAMRDPVYREESLLTLGIASAETGDYATALRSFQELSQSHPDNAGYRYNFGLALAKVGQKQQAFQVYTEALRTASAADAEVIRRAISELR